jgi:hypothetical protein
VHPRVIPGFQPDYRHYRKALVFDDGILGSLQVVSGFARLVKHLQMKKMHVRHLTTHVKFEDIPHDEQRRNFDRTDAAAFSRNIESMIALARLRKIDVVLSTLTYSEENLKDSKRQDFETYSLGIAQHNAALRTLSSRWEVPLVDVAELFPDDQQELFSGNVHLTSAGTEIKAQIFHDEMVRQQVVENRRSVSAAP